MTLQLLRFASPLLLGFSLAGCATTTSDPASADHDGAMANAPAQATFSADPPPPDATVALIGAKGMSCPLCANNSDKRLMKLDGVEAVNIDLGTGTVTVQLAADGRRPSAADLARAVQEAGFTADWVRFEKGGS